MDYKTVTFEVVSNQKTIKIRCAACGKQRNRIIKVEQTINPFNKNAEGVMKTYNEVSTCVNTELEERIIKEQSRKDLICRPCYNRLSEDEINQIKEKERYNKSRQRKKEGEK